MTDESLTPRPWAGAWLSVVVLVICAVAFAIATGFVPATTRYFPVIVSAACILVALANLAQRALETRRARGAADAKAESLKGGAINQANESPMAILRYAAWFFGYLVGIWLIGLIVASGIFVAAFLWREAKLRWWPALLSGAIVIGLVILAAEVFLIRWPSSLVDPLERFL